MDVINVSKVIYKIILVIQLKQSLHSNLNVLFLSAQIKTDTNYLNLNSVTICVDISRYYITIYK